MKWEDEQVESQPAVDANFTVEVCSCSTSTGAKPDELALFRRLSNVIYDFLLFMLMYFA